MGYTIKVKPERFDSLFGTLYPNLSMDKYQKFKFIDNVVTEKFNKYVSLEDPSRYGDLSDTSYRIDAKGSGPEFYRVMMEAEKWLKQLPRTSLHRFLFLFFCRKLSFRHPSGEIFCVDRINPLELINWLETHNIKPKHYQIFTKFDYDLSLTFKDDEHAIAFKLAFAESL